LHYRVGDEGNEEMMNANNFLTNFNRKGLFSIIHVYLFFTTKRLFIEK
jgi:hypothetical protein